jgi:cell wall-associated NlpC family hydrolase
VARTDGAVRLFSGAPSWAQVERFDYAPLDDKWAIVRLLAHLEDELAPPAGATLVVQRDRLTSGHAPFASVIEEQDGQLVWRASFAVPVAAVHYHHAAFELTSDEHCSLALPAPTCFLASAPELAAEILAGGPINRQLRRRLAALATAVAVSASSSGALAVSAQAAGNPPALTMQVVAGHKHATKSKKLLKSQSSGAAGTANLDSARSVKMPAQPTPHLASHGKVPKRQSGKATLTKLASERAVERDAGNAKARGDAHPHKHKRHDHRKPPVASINPVESGGSGGGWGTPGAGSGKPGSSNPRTKAPSDPGANAPAGAGHLAHRPPAGKSHHTHRPPAPRHHHLSKSLPPQHITVPANPAPLASTFPPSDTSAAPNEFAGMGPQNTGIEDLSVLLGLVSHYNGPPKFLIPIYKAAGHRYHVPWQLLAAINWIETDYGRNLSTSTAGAIGWMQFMPGTWLEYAVSAKGNQLVANPWNPRDAIFTAARYLAANGAPKHIRKAIFAYNHADWYVKEVLAQTEAITLMDIGARKPHVKAMLKKAISLLGKPYVYGGGHGGWGPSIGYDCSGFVSAVLHAGGYLVEPVDTVTLPQQIGILPGKGKFVTIYDRALPGQSGHVIIEIMGQFFESGGSAGPWGGGGGVEKIAQPTNWYLATFPSILHPAGL